MKRLSLFCVSSCVTLLVIINSVSCSSDSPVALSLRRWRFIRADYLAGMAKRAGPQLTRIYCTYASQMTRHYLARAIEAMQVYSQCVRRSRLPYKVFDQQQLRDFQDRQVGKLIAVQEAWQTKPRADDGRNGTGLLAKLRGHFRRLVMAALMVERMRLQEELAMEVDDRQVLSYLDRIHTELGYSLRRMDMLLKLLQPAAEQLTLQEVSTAETKVRSLMERMPRSDREFRHLRDLGIVQAVSVAAREAYEAIGAKSEC